MSFASFYGRRLRRLLPAAGLVLAVTVVASAAVLSPLHARDVMTDAQSAALYFANYRFAVLRTNWAVVEAVLVGMNHEMARKLLWNGYPTDQRGTYFRTFWDARGTAGDIAHITFRTPQQLAIHASLLVPARS